MKKMSHYQVHKFGGASLADAEKFIALKNLIGVHNQIVVVSAIQNCTVTLQILLDLAQDGQGFDAVLSELEASHLNLIRALLPKSTCRELINSLHTDFQEIEHILQDVQLKAHYSQNAQELILGYGEIWSAKILARYLSLEQQIAYLDASTVLCVEHKQGNVYVDWQQSEVLLEKFLAKHSFDILIVTGFIARAEGRRTILGRNGSDYSAAIFACLLNAKELIFWKDVDGMFTADPKQVQSAALLEAISYNQALTLACFGAKILHPKTIAPLQKQQIPIQIKNFANPNAMGTTISAFRSIHALLPKSLSVGLIGPGQVGSALLQQIHKALNSLRMQYKINIVIRGIMNSQSMLLSHDPINLKEWRDLLAHCQSPANIDEFIQHIRAEDMPHAAIIDCTADPQISQHYLSFLAQGIHVITPNKHANAGDINYYQQLKAIVQQKNCHYLYEATVCAGLPVINTLQDIIKSGDEVTLIKGVVSGTLSYIFNELANDRAFSDIVLEAKKRGFTEPDPREDLSGNDVARKLVCLAREMGFAVSLDEIQVQDLIPASLKSCSVEEFLEQVSSLDEPMQRMAQQAKLNNKRLCYVGSIHANGQIRVAIDAVSQEHSLARLQGTDNMLVFHTRRYHEQPLIIQGPGAGAEVTGAGIFADLLRLVSYLS